MSVREVALGPWVRLEGLPIAKLPPGPDANSTNPASSGDTSSDGPEFSSAPSLKKFIRKVLSEASPFIDGVAPKSGEAPTWKSKGSAKKYPASDAPVYLSERTVSGIDLIKIEGMRSLDASRKGETWFCRRSCHEDKAQKGTASWDEFWHSFKETHAETEEKFVETVIGAREAIKWDTTDLQVKVEGERWDQITMVAQEMKYQINPKPLKNRTFPVIQVTAALSGAQEFLVVSIPLKDFDQSPHAVFARDKSLVVAAYAAIERIRIIPNGGKIEWIMATASDARGVLPQFIQNMAVPNAIAKDVQMFLQWLATQRAADAKSAPVAEATSRENVSTAVSAAPTGNA